ncbi:hypothetical protein, partial [Schinkia azotoformans]
VHMELNELINNLTIKAIDNMDLGKNLRSMKQNEYEKHVLETVLDTYLKVSYTVINGEKPE